MLRRFGLIALLSSIGVACGGAPDPFDGPGPWTESSGALSVNCGPGMNLTGTFAPVQVVNNEMELMDGGLLQVQFEPSATKPSQDVQLLVSPSAGNSNPLTDGLSPEVFTVSGDTATALPSFDDDMVLDNNSLFCPITPSSDVIVIAQPDAGCPPWSWSKQTCPWPVAVETFSGVAVCPGIDSLCTTTGTVYWAKKSP